MSQHHTKEALDDANARRRDFLRQKRRTDEQNTSGTSAEVLARLERCEAKLDRLLEHVNAPTEPPQV